MKKIFLTGLLAVVVLGTGVLAMVVLRARPATWDAVQAKDSRPSGPPPDMYRTASIPSTNDSDLEFIVLGDQRVVLQNAETDFDMRVVRHAEYSITSSSFGNSQTPTSLTLAGKFQGAVKLSSEIMKGGKGLTVKFDPETVRGSDDTSKLRIKADADANLGDVDVKLTATTSEGRTTSVSITLEIYRK